MRFKFVFIVLLLPLLGISQQRKPKLVVGIVVDQMRYDYLLRFKDRFGEEGFKRLMQGLNCIDANYNYVPTYTGPGHASIYTGFTPSGNGIIANDWYSREKKRKVNCVEDSKVKTVGSKSDNGECSPIHLQKKTMMEYLKEQTGGKSISLSYKNRGAILPAGTNTDGVFWYDKSNGFMISSTFYTEKLPRWVSDFNESKVLDSYKDSIWRTKYPIATYEKSRKDENNFEVAMNEGKTIFPYSMKKMMEKESLYKLFPFTPWATAYLLDFAIKAIDNEELGKDEKTDFLNISISSTDYAGHMFGPYSVEIEDIYLRLDEDIAHLLNELDAKVGKGEYVVFLTSDHGVVSNPDYLNQQGKQGGFIELPLLKKRLEASYIKKYKANGFIEKIVQNNIYFNLKALKARKIGIRNIVYDTKQFLSKYTGIEVVFERDSLMKNEQTSYKAKMVKNGIAKRSGELIFLTKPGFLPIKKKAAEYRGTSHGSVWDYDTHVPLLFYGNGIPASVRKQNVNITQIVPTLLNYLGIGIENEFNEPPFELK